ncbi:hypothetical protein [Streptomyces sp. NPDC052114]|uniref:hypothetical protein n=1 Tax=unclassified Streptomyces TaxID=2593676 RepID=UPI00341C7B76
MFRPTGRHRYDEPAPLAGLDEIPRDGLLGLLDEGQVEQLLADGDIEANEQAFCGVEQRTTFHALHTDASRTCWTCGTTTAGDQ